MFWKKSCIRTCFFGISMNICTNTKKTPCIYIMLDPVRSSDWIQLHLDTDRCPVLCFLCRFILQVCKGWSLTTNCGIIWHCFESTLKSPTWQKLKTHPPNALNISLGHWAEIIRVWNAISKTCFGFGFVPRLSNYRVIVCGHICRHDC